MTFGPKRHSRRAAFSMAEMMIAIVILGLGLLMVATMFPIAWTKARTLAEFTNQSSITEAANTTVRLLTRVANPAGDPSSFLGDDPGGGTSDLAVHSLHLENVLADPQPGDIITFRGDYENSSGGSILEPGLAIVHPPVQVAFQERVFPPLFVRPGDFGPGDAQWDQLLAERRFAWSVLHKLGTVPVSASETRVFTMYFVTLRRTQATQRFARQDPAQPTTAPRALVRAEDVRFPVPWLVNLKVWGNWDEFGNPNPDGPTGVPSEVEANPGPTPTPNARLIARMLMSGSVLIDRVTGDAYTVKQHRFTGSGDAYDHQARMTLDREINVADVDFDWDGPDFPTHPNGVVDLLAPNDEDDRDFWVFPPAVLANRPVPGFPTFDGEQPVVGVDTRTVAIAP